MLSLTVSHSFGSREINEIDSWNFTAHNYMRYNNAVITSTSE